VYRTYLPVPVQLSTITQIAIFDEGRSQKVRVSRGSLESQTTATPEEQAGA
jgi:hypothetical protein